MEHQSELCRAVTGDDSQILELRGRDWLALKEREGALLLDLCFRYWRRRGFPYYELSPERMIQDYHRVLEYPTADAVKGNIIRGSMAGLRLANTFHPGMWGVKVGRAHSPIDRFRSDAHLKKALQRALKIWPDRFSVNASNVRRMLSTFSNTTRVSNFRPIAAKALLERFSKDGDSVLDFSAGYGGRLLGCMPLKRHYLGIDPCGEQVGGLRKMLELLRETGSVGVDAEIVQACAEDCLPQLLVLGGNVPCFGRSGPYDLRPLERAYPPRFEALRLAKLGKQDRRSPARSRRTGAG